MIVLTQQVPRRDEARKKSPGRILDKNEEKRNKEGNKRLKKSKKQEEHKHKS